jgi:hypothetical protein
LMLKNIVKSAKVPCNMSKPKAVEGLGTF